MALAKHPSGVRDQGCALPKIQERTLLLFCPEQGGWQTGEWLHDRQSWVSIADIEVVLESIPLDGSAARAAGMTVPSPKTEGGAGGAPCRFLLTGRAAAN